MKLGLLTMVLLLFSFHFANAQNTGISLKIILQGEPIIPGKNYYIPSLEDSISIKKLKFYLGTHETRSISKNTPDSWYRNYNLIDLMDSTSLTIRPELMNVFMLGVDSTTQVSGAMSGDLDPTQGMYWSWKSGYINFKLEGTSSSCPSRKNQFQFHLGGYQYPNNCYKQFMILNDSTLNASVLLLQLDSFFSHVDLRKTYSVMSPGKEAVALSILLSQSFYLKDEE